MYVLLDIGVPANAFALLKEVANDARKYADISIEQPLNALLLMAVAFGKLAVVSAAQLINALCQMLFAFGKLAIVNAVQYANA